MATAPNEGLSNSQQPFVPLQPRTTRAELAQVGERLTTPEFIRRHICPLAGGASTKSALDWEASIIQNIGTGRLTILYKGPGETFFGKMFSDALGAKTFAILKTLWDSGFNDRSPYRVSEPVAFLPEFKLLLTRPVPGRSLASVIKSHDTSFDLVGASRRAAQWLVRLHKSPFQFGSLETDWDALRLFRACSRAVKAAMAQPAHFGLVEDLLSRIQERIRSLPKSRLIVQTHQRYHLDHIFAGPETIAVIDLDGCRPSDPAKDAAEYLRVLRAAAFKRGYDMARAEAATQAFLEEYLAEIPVCPASMGCYWATFVFHSLLGGLKKDPSKQGEEWPRVMEFYVREIHQALEAWR